MRDLSGGWGDPCVRPSQAKHHRVGDPGDVSFLSFLKIKMEKSGLCMAPGVHRLHEACGWVMAAPARRLRLGEVRGSRRRDTRAVPGRAKAALLGEDVTVTEARGGMTCLRPPCGKGEKPGPLRPGPAQLPGEGAAPGRAGSCVECLCSGALACLHGSLLRTVTCGLGSLAQALPSARHTCPTGPCLCEQRFLAAPKSWGPSDPSKLG